MTLPFFIARRYLFSKKSTNAINVISAISMTGVAVATMAMVIVLSVFNGFHDLVASFFTSFDPQLEVVPVKGKSAAADSRASSSSRRWRWPRSASRTRLWPCMPGIRPWCMSWVWTTTSSSSRA